MSLQEFEILNKLGDGAFSNVYKVRRKSDGVIYALKKVRFGPLSAKEKENALNEVRVLASLDHPNIISYKQAFVDQASNTLCIVLELATGGDLLQTVSTHRRKASYLPEAQIWDIFLQIVSGLQHLHELNIMHRDLKCANIFLGSENQVKLGDLNICKIVKKGLVYTQTGTPYYASPEVWQDKPYDKRSDIWSLGCVIYELAALNPPFRAQDMQALCRKVLRGVYPPLPQQYSAELSGLIKSLLQVNPNLRPTCDGILNIPGVAKRNIKGSRVQSRGSLLGTIKLPPNLIFLNKQLPAPTYEKRGRQMSAHPRNPLTSQYESNTRRCPSREAERKNEIDSPIAQVKSPLARIKPNLPIPEIPEVPRKDLRQPAQRPPLQRPPPVRNFSPPVRDLKQQRQIYGLYNPMPPSQQNQQPSLRRQMSYENVRQYQHGKQIVQSPKLQTPERVYPPRVQQIKQIYSPNNGGLPSIRPQIRPSWWG